MHTIIEYCIYIKRLLKYDKIESKKIYQTVINFKYYFLLFF
jgi:hypothetical protein